MAKAFEGRIVVVTGGTGALGAAITRALVEQGARVHIPVLEPTTPSHFDLAAHEQVELSHGVDLGDERGVVDYFAAIPRPWALLNIAGGFTMAALCDTSLAEFDRMWRMNVVTCFLATREAVRRMRGDTGSHEGGRIVNVAARPALSPSLGAGMLAYTTAKAAVVALTEALAAELADERIWVNAIAPSIIDTPANRAVMPDAEHDRWPTPAELATVVLDLASPANRCARGAVVSVYGRA